MRLVLTCLALLVAARPVFAERAKFPSAATVLVRLVGSLRAEIDNVGQKSVVTRDHVEIGSGSGFVISPDGHVLTNEHVVNNTEITINEPNRKVVIRLNVSRIEVCFPPESAAVRGSTTPCTAATIAAADPDLDLAVLYVGSSNQPYLALGDSDVVTPGQPVQALGFPFGRTLDVGRDTLDLVVPEITTTAGTISALRANNAGERRFLQIDGNVNSGSSGGPIVDKDGFVVGVVVARLRDASNIAFAIPINQAKSFIESRGLDQLMPTHRLRLGGLQRFDAKGIALRLPDDLTDASPFRSRLDSDSDPTAITMRVDRVMSPWTLNRLEQELVKTQAFERGSIATNESRTTRVGSVTALMGRASGNAENGAEIGMAYALMDLGREKVVVRFVGPAEQFAFNESVLRDALVSVEADRLIAGELDPVEKLEWHAISAERRVPLPVGWLVEPGAPSSCTGLSNPGAAGAAVPIRDFTVTLRVAVWPGVVGPDEAASNCSSRRGSLGQASYTTRTDWLGVSYTAEGVFVRVGPQQVLQLEVLSPDQKSAYARALLAAWVKKATE